MEDGFKAMSQAADRGNADGPLKKEDAQSEGSRLKKYGVDTNQMAEAANESVSELQQLLIDEIRARPLRALGWAAAAGAILGFWVAK